jgi:tetratricopeptide (TPR) repeat protein
LLVQAGENGEAGRIFRATLRDSALTATNLYSIGVGLYEVADYRDAAKALAGAADKGPEDRDALEGWARSLVMDSAYAQVPAVAERWIALDPNNESAYVLEAQALKQQGDDRRAEELTTRVRALEVTVAGLDLERGREGGATVTGTMTNMKLDAGARVSITFTFYDALGDALGTRSRTLTMGDQGQQQDFSVDFDSDVEVGGYGYTVSGS